MWRRKRLLGELDQDIREHIGMETQDNIERGLSPEEARYAAIRRFGNVTRVKEETRAVWSFLWLEQLLQDMRYGLRMLHKSPGFTAVTILTLALGIGANTAIFSAAQAVFLRSMSYPDRDRLVFVSRGFPGFPQGGGNFSYPGYREMAAENTSFDAFAAFQNYGELALTDGAEPLPVQAEYVVPVYFELLGATARMGRLIRPDENRYEAAENIGVLSHGFWQRAFGSAPDVVGRTIHLNQRPLLVIGVMAETFQDAVGELDGQPSPDIWLPLGLSHELSGMVATDNRSAAILWAVARLKPGVSVQQANHDLATIAQREAQTYPATDRGFTLVARPLRDQVLGAFYSAVRLLVAGSVLVLLIGCGNVANLLLARLLARQREFAMRSALGASKQRLLRQVLAENLLLTLGAGALGLLFAVWGINALNTWAHQNLPSVLRFSLDRSILVASAAFSFLTGLLFGVAPAVMGSRVNLRVTLGQSSRQGANLGRRVASKILVTVEVAMAMTLLVAAGLLFKSFHQLTSVDLGFNKKNLLTMRIDLRAARYAEPLARVQFEKYMIEGAKTISGVVSVTIWGPAMLGRATWVMDAVPEGRDPNDPQNNLEFERHSTNPGGLQNLGIRILSGRDFTWQDTGETPLVAIVSDSLAKTLWPGQDSLGKRFHTLRYANWITVIGVAADARHRERFNLTDAANGYQPAGIGPQRDIYLPYTQRPNPAMVLALRVNGDSASVTRALRALARSIDPTAPLYDIAMLEERLAGQEKNSQSLATMTVLYASLALFLAVFGLFEVLASTIRRRTQEIGIRMALGARPVDVMSMVIREGLWLTVAGACGGLAGAALLTRLMATLLFGVKPSDPITYAIVGLLLSVVALVACYIPARRAMRVDPMVALRYE
jgi:predicted permease